MFNSNAFAQADDGNELFLDSIMSIQEVSVVATKRAEIIRPQTLGGIELERLNSRSVADALRYFSGVQLKTMAASAA